MTDLDEPASGAYLPTVDDVVVSTSAGGNERTQLYLIGDDGADFRPLVVDPQHIHRVGGVTRDGHWLAYAANTANDVDFDVYLTSLSEPAPPRRLFGPGGWCQPRGFSPDGRWLAVSRLTERNGDNELYLVSVDGDEVFEVAGHEDAALVGAPSWLADGSGFFFAADVDRDRSAVAFFDFGDRTWRYVLERDWDASCVMNWPGTRLLVETNEDGATRAELIEPGTLRSVGDVPLPGRGSASFGFSRDGRYLAYSFTSPVEPGDAWCYDCDEGSTARLTGWPDAMPAVTLVEPRLAHVVSFDGERIPLFVYRPDTGARPAPVIVYLHGGPEAQYIPRFDPLIQYLVAHGYAVVAPNLRGSTGYGRRFEHLDDGRRRFDVLSDLAAVHDWIGAHDGLDPGRTALMGGSYGGYLVLAGLAFQPERWAAGIDVVGISSLTTFLENTSAWRRPFREAEYGSLARDRDFLDEASPLNHAGQIQAPLMIIHGANDPRVPVSEAEQIHRVVQANGVASQLIVYPDEGHGLVRRKNRLDAYPKAVRFLDDVLGPARPDR